MKKLSGPDANKPAKSAKPAKPVNDVSLYAKVISDKENANGTFYLEHTGWCYMSHGVNFLKLIDLNGDGVRELILGYNGVNDANHSFFNMPLEIWTIKNGSPEYLGNAEVLFLGADIMTATVMRVNGKMAIVGGSSLDNSEYCGWTYDGNSLLREPLNMNESECFDFVSGGNPETNMPLNVDPSVSEKMEELFEQICSVKRECGMNTEVFPGFPPDPAQ